MRRLFIRQFIALRNDAYVCTISRRGSPTATRENTLIYYLIDLFIQLLICLKFYDEKGFLFQI